MVKLHAQNKLWRMPKCVDPSIDGSTKARQENKEKNNTFWRQFKTSQILYRAIQVSVHLDLTSNTLPTNLVCVRGMLHKPGISHGANHVGTH